MTNSSILDDVRQMLGVSDSESAFDEEIVMHINSTFNVLRQLGVGPDDGFRITGESDDETWDKFVDDLKTLNMVKSYMYLKVRLLFDPPTNGSLLEAFKNQAAEYEWRMNVDVETDWNSN